MDFFLGERSCCKGVGETDWLSEVLLLENRELVNEEVAEKEEEVAVWRGDGEFQRAELGLKLGGENLGEVGEGAGEEEGEREEWGEIEGGGEGEGGEGGGEGEMGGELDSPC